MAKVNVATQSTAGHYVENADKVVCLDEVSESFFVHGKSILTTKNHTTLQMEESCLIVPQQVYNPYSKMMERSMD